VNASKASPTRAWFQEFVNKLDAIHADGPNPLPHPSTWRFYMDVEPRFYFPGDINGVFIPRWLALTDSTNHIWSTWRLLRHNVDSIINSGSGHNQTRLSPWVAQFAGYLDPFAFYAGEEKVRRILAMQRAKKVNELLQWSGTAWTDHAVAWGHTEHVVKRVYLATVTSIKTIVGELPTGSWDHENSMLEYTLRDEDGLDYTADVEPGGTSNNLRVTVLEVELRGFENVPPMPTFSAGQTCGYSFEINLEGQTKYGINGLVQAWWNDHDGTTDHSGWYQVEPTTCTRLTAPFGRRCCFRTFCRGRTSTATA